MIEIFELSDEEIRSILGDHHWRVHWWQFVTGWRYNAAIELLLRYSTRIALLERKLRND